MVDRREAWLLLPEPVRRLPADLAAVVVLTVLTLATVFVPAVDETWLRAGFGLALVSFLPGYAFVAALFPEGEGEPTTAETAAGPNGPTGDDDSKARPVPGTETADGTRTTAEDTGGETSDPGGPDRSGIDGIERVGLSFGLSIATVALIGVGSSFTPWEIRPAPIATSVAGFTLACVAVAARRRRELSPDERFAVPYRDWIAAGKRKAFDPDNRSDTALNVVLVASLLLAVVSVGYAVTAPPQSEQFTEFYLLTENSDGELVADGYPETMSRNGTAELTVGIGNNEYETTSYTVVVQLQEVVAEGNETVVLDRTRIDQFEAAVDHNETHHEPLTLRPTRSGEDLRVQYLLYRGAAPDEPTGSNAYRELHLWIDVESA